MAQSLINTVTISDVDSDRQKAAARSRMLTAGQLASRLGVSSASAWRWGTSGLVARDGTRIRLKSYKFGRKLRYLESDAIAFAEALATANARGFAA